MRRDTADLAMKQLEKLIGRDPLLRDVLHPRLPASRPPGGFRPAVDVWETSTGWQVVMDVPGVRREQLHVRLDGHRLIVSGQRAGRPEGTSAAVQERETGSFQREFLLPFAVRGDAIQADLDAGVLRIELPRSGPSAERTIEVGTRSTSPVGPREVPSPPNDTDAS